MAQLFEMAAPPKKKAVEIYESTDKDEIKEYCEDLERQWGARGRLGGYLLLAQRAQHQVQKVLAHPIVDPDYLWMKHNRNNFAIERLIGFCVENQKRLNLTIRFYSYGVRITLRREAKIRFRRLSVTKRSADALHRFKKAEAKEEVWTGDDANLSPIFDYCDRMVHHAGAAPGRS